MISHLSYFVLLIFLEFGISEKSAATMRHSERSLGIGLAAQSMAC